jgi:hypothetical protein
VAAAVNLSSQIAVVGFRRDDIRGMMGDDVIVALGGDDSVRPLNGNDIV